MKKYKNKKVLLNLSPIATIVLVAIVGILQQYQIAAKTEEIEALQKQQITLS